MAIESLEQQNKDKEQTPEEIKSILKQALENGLRVNLVITNLAGIPIDTPGLVVEEIQGNDLRLTYIAEDGDVGESASLELARIKKAVLIKNE
jgi:hypothetical protein